MILPKERDPRLITERRGGTLTDAHHHLLAEWDWQRDRLPEDVRQLVIDDERQRDDICWNVFRE